jgi:HTH-type transcriptional regulator/antitoxin HigA
MSTNLKDERELLSKPGDTILETLEHIKMSQAELAERMGKTPSKVNDIISGKEPITNNTALQLEKVLGIDAQFWLNREMQYREKLARLNEAEIMEQYLDWVKQHPVRELKKCGYIKTERVGTPMVEEFLQFYGVASPLQWESMYINQYVTTSFRKSEVHQTALSSMAAWLRIGEIEMRRMQLPSYDKEEFKKAIAAIRDIVPEHPDDFAKQIQERCLKAGVAIIYTMCLPKAPVSGATRWIGGNPLIQLTDRYKTNDHFWFTFYHEAAHVLLHGKKDFFIEDFEGYQPDKEKEDEADRFAAKWLLPEDFEEELPFQIIEEDIETIAKKYNTHPAIVVGRLQHLGIASYSFGSQFREKVTLENYFNAGDK